MPRPKPPLVRLSDQAPGQLADCFAMLVEKHKSSTREGKPFYTCRFRDTERTACFMVWTDSAWYESCETLWRPGQCFKIRSVYGEHERYGPQLDIQNIRLVTEADHGEGFDPKDFLVRSSRDPDAMFEDLLTLARAHIADLPLRQLVLTLLERHAVLFKRMPATTRHAYNFYGGLLEHTLSVTRNCLLLVDKYSEQYPRLKPPLNRDVVLAGAILHDVGRVLEFDDTQGLAQRTVPGELLGPIFLGRDLVRDAAREAGDVNPDTLILLEHLLVAHLNLLEKDSPRHPLVPECLILHYADALDSFMEMFTRCLECDQAPGLFTNRDPILGRQLFKGRNV